VLPSGAGVLNCASATHRTIDKAVWLASGQPLQCIQGTFPNGPDSRIPGAGPYSNVFGQFYGLVYDQIPGIFFSGTFTAEQYQLVAQIMDFKRWFIGNVSFEILDRAPDYYMDQCVFCARMLTRDQIHHLVGHRSARAGGHDPGAVGLPGHQRGPDAELGL
jgi:hypothetical protein